ncbi:HotDog domain-containing protein [Trichophaea hybrida]|nr:HotDog domain-containing protein [Trichophaea hybrida]
MSNYTPNPDPDAMAKDLVDYRMMRDLKLIDARPEGRSVWSLTIPRYLCNLNLSLHGGGAAVLLDMCTMSALGPLAKDKFWVFLGGVTRSLSITYIRDCPEGTPVIIDSTVAQAGRTMALIRGEIKSPDGKVVYVTCDHNKANVGPPPDMMQYEPEPRQGFVPAYRLGDGGDSKL